MHKLSKVLEKKFISCQWFVLFKPFIPMLRQPSWNSDLARLYVTNEYKQPVCKTRIENYTFQIKEYTIQAKNTNVLDCNFKHVIVRLTKENVFIDKLLISFSSYHVYIHKYSKKTQTFVSGIII